MTEPSPPPTTPLATLKPSTPPTVQQDLSARRVVVLLFWATILLGLPFWWSTTTIERLPLPTTEVQGWTSQAPCFLRQTVTLAIGADEEGLAQVASAVKEYVWQGLKAKRGAECLDIHLVESTEGVSPKLESGKEPSISDVPHYELRLTTGDALVIKGRTALLPAKVEDLELEAKMLEVATTLLNLDAAEADPRVVKFAPTYKLVFSLLNQDASTGGALLNWEIESLLSKHLRPLLNSLALLHNFSIETQVQYFAPLTISINEDGNGTAIDEDELRAFVNAADWNLPSSITLDPVLHFILYVPSLANRPMRIRTSGSTLSPNAFITPQRGGVVIYNPPPTTSLDPLSLPSSALSQSFTLFSQQLHKLLGVPSSSSPRTLGPLEPWQLDALLRSRLSEATKSSVETLHAIIKLVSDIPNMRVGRQVQHSVRTSLSHLSSAQSSLHSSSSSLPLSLSLSHAAKALTLASKAYFDPSMLGLLYFPQEHKASVYTPLFGPIAVPLVAALVKEIKEWKERRRKKREEEKEKKE